MRAIHTTAGVDLPDNLAGVIDARHPRIIGSDGIANRGVVAAAIEKSVSGCASVVIANNLAGVIDTESNPLRRARNTQSGSAQLKSTY